MAAVELVMYDKTVNEQCLSEIVTMTVADYCPFFNMCNCDKFSDTCLFCDKTRMYERLWNEYCNPDFNNLNCVDCMFKIHYGEVDLWFEKQIQHVLNGNYKWIPHNFEYVVNTFLSEFKNDWKEELIIVKAMRD